MRVVVADDDKFVTLSLKTILEADGDITVMGIGKNGRASVELYGSQKPDVLLMDIRMDEMS